MSDPAIVVEQLSKTYVVPVRGGGLTAALKSLVRRRTRAVEAVRQVHFEVEAGEVLRVVLTVVVPIAFAVTVPAEAISGRLTAWTLVSAVALAAAMLMLSRWFWTYGLRHYSGASA